MSFRNYTWFVFIFTFLVISAGGIVRMTQSGMGCPDWPTCFGLWIPPMSEAELPANYMDYLSKQDIDEKFNAYHTWIEYINRLLGALLGIIIIIHFVWSIRRYFSSNRKIVLLSFLMLIVVGIQGWLGKMVVDGNLETGMITIHMLGAIVLAIIPLYIIHVLDNRFFFVGRRIKILTVSLVLLTLIQIILGTQVREEIDVISKSLNYVERDRWVSLLGSGFLWHRSFSWVLLILSILFASELKKTYISNLGIIQFIVLLVIIVLGIVLYYFDMPAIAQPLHLVLGCLYICLLMYIFFITRVSK